MTLFRVMADIAIENTEELVQVFVEAVSESRAIEHAIEQLNEKYEEENGILLKITATEA